jgi:hypothetical protein
MLNKQFLVPFVALFAAASALGGCVAPDGDDSDVSDVGEVGDSPDDVSDGTDALTLSGCSAAQVNAINAAFANASRMTTGSISLLDDIGASQARFRTYFGSDVTGRRATAKTMLTRIQTRLKKKDFSITCAASTQPVCQRGVYAFSGGTTVNICPSALSAGAVKLGAVLVHEVSHTLGTTDTGCGTRFESVALNGAYCYQGFVYNDSANRW